MSQVFDVYLYSNGDIKLKKHLIGHVSRGGTFISACKYTSLKTFRGFTPNGDFGVAQTPSTDLQVTCKLCWKLFIKKENREICCLNPTCTGSK